MPRGKYVIPHVMGSLGQELYLVNGTVPVKGKIALAKVIRRRGVIEKDLPGLNKIPEIACGRYAVPTMLTEIQVIDGSQKDTHTLSEAMAVEGFITNTRKLSKSQSELDGWFLFERKGDLTPLKLAKFSINLLEDQVRQALVESVNGLTAWKGR